MASHTNDGEHVDARSAASQTRLVIVDHLRGKHDDAIDEVLSRCGLTARHVSAASIVRRRADDCGIAVVAVAEQPGSRAAVLDDVCRLKDDGYTVVCHAAGASTWPLGVQCRLLLAGATHVLDSSSHLFADELRERLTELLNAAIERARENRLLEQQMGNLGVVGSSAGITGVFRWIVAASALTDVPVLITGETGTGKELAARAIHRLDPRRCDRPFVAVNCGAISAGLAESELFGHRRGAFTGAERERLGLIRAARGGVLFLDEIGDLEPNLQAKLLRVLQERHVLSVGDDQEVPIDVRIIAATNRDLEEMIRQRTFRSDLFHRLNVLSVRMPPLRDRPEDIEPLVTHFLDKCAVESQQRSRTATPEVLRALRRVALPGNVRQLENVIRRAVVTAKDGDRVQLRDLPPEVWLELSRADTARTVDALEPLNAPPHDASSNGDAANVAPPAREDRGAPLDAVAVLDATSWKLEGALDLCEQQLVAAALGASRGNRSRAARLLGISPRCIFNKMRKHRLIA